MKLLDLFCGAGGAAVGYHRAGFDEIVGVDNRPMPRYPFPFVLADALEYVKEHGSEFDAIHASPPCQRYSRMTNVRGTPFRHPDLVRPTREALKTVGREYVIENVRGAPLIDAAMLCGEMFGLRVYRHRYFEASFEIPFLLHAHSRPLAPVGRPAKAHEMMSIIGHFPNVAEARLAMDTPWMTQHDMAQAIPPAYTEFIGRQLIEKIRKKTR